MKFCLAHHPVQPEQEAIVVIGRVVEPVGVGQERAEPGTQLIDGPALEMPGLDFGGSQNVIHDRPPSRRRASWSRARSRPSRSRSCCLLSIGMRAQRVTVPRFGLGAERGHARGGAVCRVVLGM